MLSWRLLIAVVGVAAVSCAPPALPTPTPSATAVPTPRPTATATPMPIVRLGGLFDLSGSSSERARPYVDAIRLRIDVANRSGGVNRRRLELVEADYGNDVVRAVDTYKRLAAQERVVAMFGWNSSGADALSPMLPNDQLPYLSASYADILVDRPPDRAYNFLLGSTYGEQVRALYRYVDESWKAKDHSPSIALVFSDDVLGRSPITGARADAGRAGFKIADEQALAPATRDATPALHSVHAKAADFVLVSADAPLAARVAKGAAEIGLKAPLLLLGAAVDEEFAASSGVSAESAIGATSFAFSSEDRPGFAELKAAYASRSVAAGQLNARQVQGWLNAQLLLEGIRRVTGRINGEAIKHSLETIRDYDTGGVTAPITWTAEQHVGSHRVKLYQLQGGQWKLLAEP